MPQLIIDLLEAIQVNVEHADWLMIVGTLGDEMIQGHIASGTIAQARQAVVFGLVQGIGLSHLAIGDVIHHALDPFRVALHRDQTMNPTVDFSLMDPLQII